MDRKTALSAAGAFTLTAVAAVSALSLTMGAGAGTANEPTTPVVAEPEVVTEYEVIQVEPAADESLAVADAAGSAEYETSAAGGYADAPEMESEEYEEEHHEEEHPETEGDEYEDAEMEGDEYEDEDEDDD
jgi:hypothetical protein